MNHRHIGRAGVALLAALAVAGCTAQKSALEADYGSSVREMRAASSANPAAHSAPSAAAVEGGDPEVLAKSVDKMRKAADQADDVKQDLVINVGGGG